MTTQDAQIRTAPAVSELTEALWQQVNAAHLAAHLRRLRLLLDRRIRFLRTRWHGDDDDLRNPMVIRDATADRLLIEEDPADAVEFHDRDEQAIEAGQAIRHLEGELAAQAAWLAAAGRPPAIEVLCQSFSLNGFERDVLLLAAAPEIDSSFGRLYAYAQDDVNLRHATLELAAALFCKTAAEQQQARRCLTPDAALRRYQLVQCSGGAPVALRGVATDDRVLDYLDGLNRLDERASDLMRPVPGLPIAPAQEQVAADVFELLGPLTRATRWAGLNLFGPRGSGRVAVAHALAARLGLRLYRADVARLPAAGPERAQTLRLLAREAILAQIALYIESVDSEDEGHAAFAYFIDGIPVFFIAGTRMRLRSARELLAVPVASLEPEGRKVMWQRALNGASPQLAASTDAFVEQFEFGPEMVIRAVSAATVKARLRGDRAVSTGDLWDACREHSSWELRQLAHQIRPVYDWQDIVVPDEVRRQLREIAAQVTHRTRVYRAWGFGAKLARGRGVSALFSGVSGTGKTMAAEILANELHLDLYGVDLAGVVSKYIGETEKNLRRIFDAAERSGAILFFDEADALFGKRTEVKDSHDRFANIEINYLLQRMEEYRGLSILATNRKSDVDRAFLRRIRFLVDFPFPEADQRLLIWQRAFPPQTPLATLDYDMLSRMEIAGGNIRNIALSAAFLAAEGDEPIGMPHLVRAARREYTKMDKMLSDAEFHRAFSKQARPQVRS
jgi:SpoVK/Ycf46/Vps4 family AAA+-type ATPase